MRSFRLRVFLIVWPLVVVALVVLGTVLGSWSRVELMKMSMQVESVRRLGLVTGDFIDSLAAVSRADTAALRALAMRLAERDSLVRGMVVASQGRGVIINTVPGVRDDDIEVGDGRLIVIESVSRDGGMEAVTRAQADGIAIDPADDPDPRFLMVMPDYSVLPDYGDELARPHAVREDPAGALQDRIIQAMVVGSIVAGLLTLVLAGQVTRRVTTLAGATEELGRGNLAARVPVRGRDEVADLATAFNAMASSLEESEAQRRRMVSDVAHELRTPLTNLIGLVRMALDGIRPADRALLTALEEEGELLHRLVDDLRDLALADAGELRVHPEVVDVAAVVRRAVAGFDSRLEIAVAVDGDVPEASADPSRLGQVVRNLVRNAVLHSPAPGSVTVRVSRDDEGVAIAVADHGPGIAPEHLERIWDRFYRVDPSRARDTGGMGLGLSVARRLVEAMGGTIAVDSAPGEGSRFMVRLPATT